MKKNIGCGVVKIEDVGRTITLAGWVHRWRDHGNVIFVDLRDRYGTVQVVFNPEHSTEAHQIATKIRPEWVVQITGEVCKRPTGTENLTIPTGQVEVSGHQIEVLNPSHTPPFEIDGDQAIDEYLRLRYRYLDLRREKMRDNLILRHQVTTEIRRFLDSQGFLEIETPMLTRSTPEGARDYLVPSRIHPGQFYALPQSPQQLKQLLMVAGIEKYFQIARCFRDEDLRADRQPEFTQLDLEMSFVDEDDILDLMEELYSRLVVIAGTEKQVTRPFPRLSYKDVVDRYGTDKPDLRFGMELRDFSDIAATTEFQVFQKVVASGGVVKGIAATGCAHFSRRQLDELTDFVKSRGASGLVALGLSGEGSIDDLEISDITGPVSKWMTASQVCAIAERLNASRGDLLLLVAGQPKVVDTALSQLRVELGGRLGLADPDMLFFAFIVDFPLFEWSDLANGWVSVHHPFTAPKQEDLLLLETDTGNVGSRAYDMICNGVELASGSIRIHERPLQESILRLLGYSDEEIKEQFGHLLEALEYGAPPHGGIAPGIDRFVALLSKHAESIRDVIAFPKTQSGTDPLLGAPGAVMAEQLKDLHLRVIE